MKFRASIVCLILICLMFFKHPSSEIGGEIVFLNYSVKRTTGPFQNISEGDSLFAIINDTLFDFHFKITDSFVRKGYDASFRIIAKKNNHTEVEYLIHPLKRHPFGSFSYYAVPHTAVVSNNGSGKVYVGKEKLENRRIISWK